MINLSYLPITNLILIVALFIIANFRAASGGMSSAGSRQLFFICALFFLVSCEKEEEIQKHLFDGTYIGTFQRQIVWTENDTAHITLTFNGNQWSGSSNFEKYPALCRGTYSINGDTIIFENECIWTAEFDWTLILAGKYLLTKTGNTVEFSKDYRSASSDTYNDKYKLTKELLQ